MTNKGRGKRKRSPSSRLWLHEHARDLYVQRARRAQLRSRACFKLHDLQSAYLLFKPGMTVVDLGAAPGGWSQYAQSQIGPQGRVIACDRLPMDSLPAVEFLQGDICEPRVLEQLLILIGSRKAQAVLSDMAPNISGIATVDQACAVELARSAFGLCQHILAPGGCFVVKMFQGEEFIAYWRKIQNSFVWAKICKPAASRLRSKEVYIVATGYKL